MFKQCLITVLCQVDVVNFYQFVRVNVKQCKHLEMRIDVLIYMYLLTSFAVCTHTFHNNTKGH